MGKAITLDKEILIQKYIGEELGIKPLAAILGVNEKVVKRNLIEYGVELRDRKTQTRRDTLNIWRNNKTEKLCSGCKEWKSVDDYHKDSAQASGYSPKCKSCKKGYYEENREDILVKQGEYQKANPEVGRKAAMKHYDTHSRVDPKPEIVFPTPTDRELSYMAGLFDGEGSIGIYINKNTGSLQYQATFTNVFYQPFEMFQKYFGGTITTKTQYEGKQLCYQWYGSTFYAYRLAKQILPICMIKKEQLEYFIETYDRFTLSNNDGTGRKGIRLTSEQIQERQAAVDHLKLLKRPVLEKVAKRAGN